MSYQIEYRESIENPEAFWSRQAELIRWYEKPKSILSQDEKGFYHWFKGGKLNTSTWPSISMWKTGGPSRRL